MAVNVINCGNNSLPRSLDVAVTVTRPGAEQTTDLSIPLFVQNGGGFDHGAGRVAFYSTFDAVAADARVTAEGRKAARDFFAQPRRARRMAIGQAFSTPQTGYLLTGLVGSILEFQAVTDGSFAISINGVSANITGLDFSAAASYPAIETVIQNGLNAQSGAGFSNAVVDYLDGQFVIRSGTSGDGSAVSVLGSAGVGTDISGPLYMNGLQGVTVPGYAPTGLVGELDMIAEATRCGGEFIYGWALDEVFRDTAEQIQAGQWAQSRTAIMPLVTNSPLAWDPNSTTDIGPEIIDLGLFRAWPFYHDNAEFYPDMALLAIMLSVNYAQRNSTITAKFKDLVGIPIVGITETQWSVLEGKGYNTFTLTGNTSRVTREGTTGNVAWYMDDVVNLDNLVEELQVAEYNVFLRNGKVPYTTAGQAMLEEAIQQVCERYVFNGSLADRRVLDLSQNAGYRVEPAYTINASPIELQTVSDRSQRIGPPFVVDLNMAGAIHSIAININAYS